MPNHSDLDIRTFQCNALQENTFVVSNSEGHALIIDCGATTPTEREAIRQYISEKALTPVAHVLTHAHFDHIYGLNRLLNYYPDVPIYCNASCQAALVDDKANMSRYHEQSFVLEQPDNIHLIDEGDVIPLSDDDAAQVFATPGHHPSCLSFLIGKHLFTGDAYIPETKVVTILPGGDKQQAVRSVQRILQLAHQRIIYPGHGDAINALITS